MIHLPYQAISTRSAANELSWLAPGQKEGMKERNRKRSAALPAQHGGVGN